MHVLKESIFYPSAITIMFSERTYNVDEDAGPAQPVLVLSNPSSTAFTVRVREQSGTATSKQTNTYINI